MPTLKAKKVVTRIKHKMYGPGKQVPTTKSVNKRGSNRGRAFKSPPVARVKKSKKNY